jgi:hypothetical protein
MAKTGREISPRLEGSAQYYLELLLSFFFGVDFDLAAGAFFFAGSSLASFLSGCGNPAFACATISANVASPTPSTLTTFVTSAKGRAFLIAAARVSPTLGIEVRAASSPSFSRARSFVFCDAVSVFAIASTLAEGLAASAAGMLWAWRSFSFSAPFRRPKGTG